MTPYESLDFPSHLPVKREIFIGPISGDIMANHICPLEQDGKNDCDLFACPICEHCLSHCVGHSQLLDGLKLLLRPVHRRTGELQSHSAEVRLAQGTSSACLNSESTNLAVTDVAQPRE